MPCTSKRYKTSKKHIDEEEQPDTITSGEVIPQQHFLECAADTFMAGVSAYFKK